VQIHVTPVVGRLLLTLALIAGCSSPDETATAQQAVPIGHVHGVAQNPADQLVYLATHTGVYRLKPGGKPALVANRYQDTMAFTIVAADDFLASGHPAISEDTPNPLGLIRSTDRAKSWQPVALGGEKDFHAIDVAGPLIYAYGSDGQLMRTTDRRSWSTVLRGPDLIDIAANPQQPEQVLVTTGAGELLRLNTAGSPRLRPVPGAPPLTFIDRIARGNVVGIDENGQVFSSDRDGRSWARLSSLPGAPEALNVQSETWLAATEWGVYSSKDAGRSWQQLITRNR